MAVAAAPDEVAAAGVRSSILPPINRITRESFQGPLATLLHLWITSKSLQRHCTETSTISNGFREVKLSTA
jgi:hypothetical protein